MNEMKYFIIFFEDSNLNKADRHTKSYYKEDRNAES